MASKRYPTDLSDAEWSPLEPHLPAPKRRGRPRLHSPREILDAGCYVLKSGCQWRMLPRDFPPWKTGPPARPAALPRTDSDPGACSSPRPIRPVSFRGRRGG